MVNKYFFTFIKSLDNEEEKVQILILFLEALDFTNKTKFGNFFLFTMFCCNFKIVVIYVFFFLASNRSSSFIPSHPITLKPIIPPCKTLSPTLHKRLVHPKPKQKNPTNFKVYRITT